MTINLFGTMVHDFLWRIDVYRKLKKHTYFGDQASYDIFK